MPESPLFFRFAPSFWKGLGGQHIDTVLVFLDTTMVTMYDIGTPQVYYIQEMCTLLSKRSYVLTKSSYIFFDPNLFLTFLSPNFSNFFSYPHLSRQKTETGRTSQGGGSMSHSLPCFGGTKYCGRCTGGRYGGRWGVVATWSTWRGYNSGGVFRER